MLLKEAKHSIEQKKSSLHLMFESFLEVFSMVTSRDSVCYSSNRSRICASVKIFLLQPWCIKVTLDIWLCFVKCGNCDWGRKCHHILKRIPPTIILLKYGHCTQNDQLFQSPKSERPGAISWVKKMKSNCKWVYLKWKRQHFHSKCILLKMQTCQACKLWIWIDQT